ncbi:MAG: glycosyltransferase family 2 protein [Candidatus Sumerlaeia bacterium]
MSNNSDKAPRVLAIVVNWNKKEFVESLLGQLQNLDRPPDEIVVVDNASTDGSREMLERDYSHLHLVFNEENLGGSGGFNTGLRWGLEHGGYDYFWLLDNDVVVHDGALKAMLDLAESDRKIGMVGGRIVVLGHPELTQEIGARVEWPRCFLRKMGADWENAQDRQKVYDVDYVAACSMMVRVKAVEEVGIWDSGYFVFFDDIEWGIRFRRAGWKVKATRDSVIEHDSFHERRLKNKPGQDHLCLRNALFFMHQFCPRRIRPFFFLRVFRFIVQDALQQRLLGRINRARSQELAAWDFFRSRRGKSNRSFGLDTLAKEVSRDVQHLQEQLPGRKKRLLFWTYSAEADMLDRYHECCRIFPDYQVDIFTPEECMDTLHFDAEPIIRRPTKNWRNRMKLSRWVLANYEAIVREDQTNCMLWEFLLPAIIWYSSDGTFGIMRKKWSRFFWQIALRPLVLASAFGLTVLEELKPRAKMDYYTWDSSTKHK